MNIKKAAKEARSQPQLNPRDWERATSQIKARQFGRLEECVKRIRNAGCGRSLRERIEREMEERGGEDMRRALERCVQIQDGVGALETITEWRRQWMVFVEKDSEMQRSERTEATERFLTFFMKEQPDGVYELLTSLIREQMRSGVGGSELSLEATTTMLFIISRHETILVDAITEMTHSKVQECREAYGQEVYEALGVWLFKKIQHWAANLTQRVLTAEQVSELLSSTTTRFQYQVAKELFAMRKSQMLVMSVGYPATLGGLKDLQVTMNVLGLRDEVVEESKRIYKEQVVHGGVSTREIVYVYVRTVHAARRVDPSGVLLNRIAEPIRRELHGRHDAMESLLAQILAGTSEQDLAEQEMDEAFRDGRASSGTAENLASALRSRRRELDDLEAVAEKEYGRKDWMPEPLEGMLAGGAQESRSVRRDKESDVTQLLVSIYESKGEFVEKLERMLGTRLLSGISSSYNMRFERELVSTLKARFGDASLQRCDGMLRDVAKSQSIDALHGGPQWTHALVLTEQFWPQASAGARDDGAIQVCAQLEGQLDAFAQYYKEAEPRKRIKWLRHLGLVALTVHVGGRALQVRVTPLFASVLMLLADGPQTADEIGAALGAAPAHVARALYYWGGMHVVRRDADLWMGNE